MDDSDDSGEDAGSFDVSSGASWGESCGWSTSKSGVESESTGVHDAGGQAVSDNEHGGGQATSDEDPGGQTPADQLVKKQERNETDGVKAPSSRHVFETRGEQFEGAWPDTSVRPVCGNATGKHGSGHWCTGRSLGTWNLGLRRFVIPNVHGGLAANYAGLQVWTTRTPGERFGA